MSNWFKKVIFFTRPFNYLQFKFIKTSPIDLNEASFMSQFILCRGNSHFSEQFSGIKIIRLTPNHTFLWEIGHELFKQLSLVEQLWFLAPHENSDFDTLFTYAQRELYDGKPLEQTQVGKFLLSAIFYVDEMVMWYGNDWQDLTPVFDEKKFMLLLKEGLENSMCEVYLRYYRFQA